MQMNKKAMLALIAGLGLGGIVLAETDYVVSSDKGVEKVVTRKLYVRGNNASATIAGDLTVGGQLLVSGDLSADDITAGAINADAVVWTVVAAQNVTNGQAVTLVAGTINMLNGVGRANGATNTITITDFAADDVGKITYLANAYAATNLVKIAKTGNFYGDTIELGAGDSMAIFAGTTNVLYGK